MTIIVTGSAGFIGSAVVQKILASGEKVVGIDNHNSYYDPILKEARLKIFSSNPNYVHYRQTITSEDKLSLIFRDHKPQIVINLAAQAGVRDSIDNPLKYIDGSLP